MNKAVIRTPDYVDRQLRWVSGYWRHSQQSDLFFGYATPDHREGLTFCWLWYVDLRDGIIRTQTAWFNKLDTTQDGFWDRALSVGLRVEPYDLDVAEDSWFWDILIQSATTLLGDGHE